jgi:hypothetical protein
VVADIQVQNLKTRVWYEGDTYIFDEAFWPQCGYEFAGSGPTTEVQSAVMGSKVNSVNLVFSDEGTAYIDVQLG